MATYTMANGQTIDDATLDANVRKAVASGTSNASLLQYLLGAFGGQIPASAQTTISNAAQGLPYGQPSPASIQAGVTAAQANVNPNAVIPGSGGQTVNNPGIPQGTNGANVPNSAVSNAIAANPAFQPLPAPATAAATSNVNDQGANIGNLTPLPTSAINHGNPVTPASSTPSSAGASNASTLSDLISGLTGGGSTPSMPSEYQVNPDAYNNANLPAQTNAYANIANLLQGMNPSWIGGTTGQNAQTVSLPTMGNMPGQTGGTPSSTMTYGPGTSTPGSEANGSPSAPAAPGSGGGAPGSAGTLGNNVAPPPASSTVAQASTSLTEMGYSPSQIQFFNNMGTNSLNFMQNLINNQVTPINLQAFMDANGGGGPNSPLLQNGVSSQPYFYKDNNGNIIPNPVTTGNSNDRTSNTTSQGPAVNAGGSTGGPVTARQLVADDQNGPNSPNGTSTGGIGNPSGNPNGGSGTGTSGGSGGQQGTNTPNTTNTGANFPAVQNANQTSADTPLSGTSPATAPGTDTLAPPANLLANKNGWMDNTIVPKNGITNGTMIPAMIGAPAPAAATTPGQLNQPAATSNPFNGALLQTLQGQSDPNPVTGVTPINASGYTIPSDGTGSVGAVTAGTVPTGNLGVTAGQVGTGGFGVTAGQVTAPNAVTAGTAAVPDNDRSLLIGNNYQPGGTPGGLAGSLLAQNSGATPSLGQLAFQSSLMQSLQAEQAAANSARGTSPALAARMAQEGMAATNQGALLPAAQLSLNQSIANNQQLGSIYQGINANDLAASTTTAGLTTAANQSTAANALATGETNAQQTTAANEAAAANLLAAGQTNAGQTTAANTATASNNLNAGIAQAGNTTAANTATAANNLGVATANLGAQEQAAQTNNQTALQEATTNVQNQQQANLTNTNFANQNAQQQASLNQGVNLANQNAQQGTNALIAGALPSLLGSQNTLTQTQLQNQQNQQTLQANQRIAMINAAAAARGAQVNQASGMTSSLLGSPALGNIVQSLLPAAAAAAAAA